MDLKSFLDLEREHLRQERERLSGRSNAFSSSDSSITAQQVEFAQCDASESGKIETNIAKNNKAVNKRFAASERTNNAIKGEGSESAATKHKRNASFSTSQTRVDQHDMDQWISDTFYSHFPGFNNEYQKRQLYLQKRQTENQENLIRHQMLNAKNGIKPNLRRNQQEVGSKPNVDSASSNNSSVLSNGNVEDTKPVTTTQGRHFQVSSIDDSLSSVRSGSSRYKLLQDLRHTNLANMINRSNDDEIDWKRKQAEVETARKKQYQQELMQQIEEKRRTIKMLKDKEIQQEKVLTTRLEEQLKTMQLEEKLEKERLKATKVRYDVEQNHLLREHLLSKLENDTKLLQEAARSKTLFDNEINKENMTTNSDKKVYRYFSNSEKHEYNYRKKSTIPAEIYVIDDSADLPKIEMECFHLSEKICPSCDEPLREFEDYCLRCQTKNASSSFKGSKYTIKNSHENSHEKESTKDEFAWKASQKGHSSHLACIKCERYYNLCATCLKKSDVCKACQNKRNVCMNCRSTLCSFCLEEIACGRDTETLHVNEKEPSTKAKSDTQNDVYIQEVSVGAGGDNSIENESAPDSKYYKANNLNVYDQQEPSLSSINGRVSMYQQRKTTNDFQDMENYNSMNDNSKDFEYEEFNIERLRRDTDSRLSRYLKNYRELAFQSRGTQTTPNSTARRDIVISGEQSLSIPLLREMPRMTRKESSNSKRFYSENIENLKRRWEIPAVQKQSVSRASPRVITQIGAVRRQLQTETLFSDDSI